MAEQDKGTKSVEGDPNKPADSPETAVDWGKVDPTTIPHEVVRKSEPFKGVLAEVQGLREQNRQLTEAVAARAPAAQPGTEPDEDEPGEPDDLLTRRQAQAMLERDRKERKKEAEERAARDNVVRENESISQLQQDYAPGKAPAGLDANTVLREGVPWLAQNEPALLEGARRSRNPAKRIYELALSLCPTIAERAEAHRNEQVLERLNKPGSVKGPGARGRAPGEAPVSTIVGLSFGAKSGEVMSAIDKLTEEAVQLEEQATEGAASDEQ